MSDMLSMWGRLGILGMYTWVGVLFGYIEVLKGGVGSQCMWNGLVMDEELSHFQEPQAVLPLSLSQHYSPLFPLQPSPWKHLLARLHLGQGMTGHTQVYQ